MLAQASATLAAESCSSLNFLLPREVDVVAVAVKKVSPKDRTLDISQDELVSVRLVI